ncbi:TPA: hypothetical protein ACIIU2_004363, partial [Providencia stuartii]
FAASQYDKNIITETMNEFSDTSFNNRSVNILYLYVRGDYEKSNHTINISKYIRHCINVIFILRERPWLYKDARKSRLSM